MIARPSHTLRWPPDTARTRRVPGPSSTIPPCATRWRIASRETRRTEREADVLATSCAIGHSFEHHGDVALERRQIVERRADQMSRPLASFQARDGLDSWSCRSRTAQQCHEPRPNLQVELLQTATLPKLLRRRASSTSAMPPSPHHAFGEPFMIMFRKRMASATTGAMASAAAAIICPTQVCTGRQNWEITSGAVARALPRRSARKEFVPRLDEGEDAGRESGDSEIGTRSAGRSAPSWRRRPPRPSMPGGMPGRTAQNPDHIGRLKDDRTMERQPRITEPEVAHDDEQREWMTCPGKHLLPKSSVESCSAPGSQARRHSGGRATADGDGRRDSATERFGEPLSELGAAANTPA